MNKMTTQATTTLVFAISGGGRCDAVRLSSQGGLASIAFSRLNDRDEELSEEVYMGNDDLHANLVCLGSLEYLPIEALGITLTLSRQDHGRSLYVEFNSSQGDHAALSLPINYVLERLA